MRLVSKMIGGRRMICIKHKYICQMGITECPECKAEFIRAVLGEEE